jgi:hypothetical protein
MEDGFSFDSVVPDLTGGMPDETLRLTCISMSEDVADAADALASDIEREVPIDFRVLELFFELYSTANVMLRVARHNVFPDDERIARCIDTLCFSKARVDSALAHPERGLN